MNDEQMIRTYAGKAGLRRVLRCRGSILRRHLLSAWSKWDWLMPTGTKRARKSSCFAFWRCHSCLLTTLNWRFRTSERRSVQTRIKTRISRYDNSAYIYPHRTYSSCVLQATASELTVHLYMHETNCDSDDDYDETTDSGEEVVEAQTADDPRQNDVCQVCL